MSWIIGSAVAVGLLANWLGKTTSSASSITNSSSADDSTSHQHLFDDDSLGSATSFSDSIFDNSPSINPANGLPMIGGIDIEGNPYGTDSSHDFSISSTSFDDSFSDTSSSIFDDSFSTSCSSSMFEDSFSSSSFD